VPIDGVVPEAWRDAVVERDPPDEPRINRLTYEICVLQTLQKRRVLPAAMRGSRFPKHDDAW
jgi:hypothetical protein